jgi:hypothetical protein
MIRSLILAAITCSLVAPTALAQGNVTVGPPGSGADYSTVNEGLLAVPERGVVELLAGEHGDLRIDGRSLSVIGHDGAQVSAIVVENIAADQAVRIANLTVQPSSLLGPIPPRITVQDALGRVELIGVDAPGLITTHGGSFPFGFASAGLVVVDSNALALTDCDVYGGLHQYSTISQTWYDVRPGAEIYNSVVDFVDCRLLGMPNTVAAPGLEIGSASRVVLTRTTALGGHGALQYIQSQVYSGKSAPAVRVSASVLVIAGGASSFLRGGNGTYHDPDPDGTCTGWSCLPIATSGAAGVAAYGGSYVLLSPDTQLESGLSGGPNPVPSEATSNDGTALISLEGVRRPTLAFEPALTTPGGVTVVEAGGEPNEVHLLYFSGAGIAPIDVPGLAIRIHLDPLTVLYGGWITIDANGVGALPFTTPSDPFLVGLGLVAQSLVADPTAVRISNPATLIFVP